MAKRAIKSPYAGFCVGLEHDHLKIRGARLAGDGKGGWTVSRLEEVQGDFAEEAGLIDGYKQIKDRLGIGARDSVIACLGGKHVFSAQLPFRKLPKEEMEQALRLELRKSMHFEVATAALDYQILKIGDTREEGEAVQVLVALVGGGLLPRHLKVLEKAGIKPAAVDVLPVGVSNAIWAWMEKPRENPQVALHVGPLVSTIVIDGLRSSFFNRNVYFSAEEVFGKDPMAAANDKRLVALADEVARSLAFYEKSTFASGVTEILLLGDYLEGTPLPDQLRRLTGIPVRRMDIAKRMNQSSEGGAGRFDLAMALAMRGGD